MKKHLNVHPGELLREEFLGPLGITPYRLAKDAKLPHQRVNETVMQQYTVIPMSFGTVFKTDDDIIELLRSAYEAFNDVLNKMQDKFEFGLNDKGEIVPLELEVGNKILFGKSSGSDIKVDGNEYLIMREDEVLAVIA